MRQADAANAVAEVTPFALPELLAFAGVAAAPIAMRLRAHPCAPSDVRLRDTQPKGLGLADYLPYDTLIEPDLVLTSGGGLAAMFEITFEDMASVSDYDGIGHAGSLNSALAGAGSAWMHQAWTMRVEPPELVTRSFAASAGQRVLDESHVAHLVGKRYGLKHLVAWTYQPPVEQQKWVERLIFTGETALEAEYARVRDGFERALVSYADAVSEVGSIRRLGTHPRDPGRSELLEAIFEVLYGDVQSIRVGEPFAPATIGGLLGARDVEPLGLAPRIGRKHVRVLGVYGYPAQSHPGMLDAFLSVPGAGFRLATRSIMQDPEIAKASLEKRSSMWLGQKTSLMQKALPGISLSEVRVDRYAAQQQEIVDQQIHAVQTGIVGLAHFSAKVVFLNEDLEALTSQMRAVEKTLTGTGLVVKAEDFNAFEGWLGHVPCDGHDDVRNGFVDTLNIARLWPSANCWGGLPTWDCPQCPPGAPPVLQGVTDTGEDFAWDPHCGGRGAQSFICVGNPGTGKSTNLNAIAAGYRRSEHHQVFGFDKNGGQFVTAMFLGGEHVERQEFWLFDALEDDDRRAYLGTFLAYLADVNGVDVAQTGARETIRAALASFLQHDRAHRTLSNFIGLALRARDDADGKLTDALAQYVAGGVYRGLFDGAPAIATRSSYVVYELGRLLGAGQNDVVAAPAVMWLMHEIEQRFGGRSTLVLLDEAWEILQAPKIASILAENLRTYRHRHVGLGLFTHVLSDIRGSAVGKILTATCKSRLFFPDPEAAGDVRAFYEELDLTPSQVEAIRHGVRNQDCFASVDGRFGAFRLPLSPAEIAVFGCTAADDVARARRLIAEFPEDWRERHLRAHGCTKEADRLRSLRRSGTLNPYTIREELAS
jgi:type IV secretory pathway VirB4 component